MNITLISLELAKKQNLKYFFTGKFCARGHLTQRYTSTRACIECAKMNLSRNRKENPIRTKLQKKKDDKKYYKKNKKKILANSKKYHSINKERLKEHYSNWHKENYKKNKERITARNNEYIKNNRAKVRNRYNIYRRKKKAEDPTFKIIESLRRRVNQSIRHSKYEKTSSTRELVGCSIKDLKLHLEKLWQPGMSWKNYNYYGWHIDHKLPVHHFKTKYNFSDPEIQKKCFHYKNLQPMWAKDNFKKSSKLNYKGGVIV